MLSWLLICWFIIDITIIINCFYIHFFLLSNNTNFIIAIIKNVNESNITERLGKLETNMIKEIGEFKDKLSRDFNDDFLKNSFGYGFGNCEYSSFEIFTSNFYKI